MAAVNLISSDLLSTSLTTLLNLQPQALHSNPPPPLPPFAFPILLTNPDLVYRTTGSSGTLTKTRITSRGRQLNTVSEFDASYTLSRDRPMRWTLRAPPSHRRHSPLSLLPPSHPDHALHCPHLHTIAKSCASIARPQPCVAVSYGKLCRYGHDFASSRIHSQTVMLPQHRQEYLGRRDKPGTVFLDRTGRWCWKRGEVLWRVGEMVDASIGKEQGSWAEDEV